jgi:hypothetical protein
MDSLLFLRPAGGFQSVEVERVQAMCRFQSSASSRLWAAGGDRNGGQEFAARKGMSSSVVAKIDPEADSERENQNERDCSWAEDQRCFRDYDGHAWRQ